MPTIMRAGKWQAEELLELCIQHETEIARLRAALEEISSCVQLLGLDGWSNAPHVMNVITKALSGTR